MIDVTAMGELLIDFACQAKDKEGYPTMAAHPGGAPCNFLAALSKFGLNTAFIGKVGADAFGNMLMGTLKKYGICTDGVVQDTETFTTMAFVTFDGNGDRQFSFARRPGADTRLTFQECRLDLIDEAKVFHFGTLSLTDEPARDATRQLVAYAKSKGKLITFDPNLRLPLWQRAEQAKEEILWGLRQADIVKISEEEVVFLWGCSAEEGARKLLEEFGVKLVFVTMGADGSFYANGNASGYTTTIKVKTVDTTGAGDIFGGSAVSQVLKMGKDPADLNQEELDYIAAFASTAATLSTRVFGGITSVPNYEEVLANMPKGSLS